jgi:hypothetical protein
MANQASTKSMKIIFAFKVQTLHVKLHRYVQVFPHACHIFIFVQLQLESCSQLLMNIQFSEHTASLKHMTVGSS